MKLLFQVLLLSVMLAFQKCQDTWNLEDFYAYTSGELEPQNVTVPNITVYQQMEEREHDSVIVLCIFDQMFEMRGSWQMQSFELSVESELNYTKEIEECTTLDRKICVFMVTVSPPASFTCVHEIYSDGEVKYLHSQTYNYNKSVLDNHKEEVSLFYICFSSFIAVGLVIMTAAVIVTTIRSKAKDSINHTTTVTVNDYLDA